MTLKFVTLTAITLGFLACSTTRYSAPEPGAFQPPALQYAAFKGSSVAVRVLDHRGVREESEALVQSTRDAIVRSLKGAGITLSKSAQASFEIRIVRYRADFEMGNWTGCVRFQGIVETESEQRHELPVEKCVRKSNLWGGRSGDDAVQEAYSDALAELLSRVDQIRE